MDFYKVDATLQSRPNISLYHEILNGLTSFAREKKSILLDKSEFDQLLPLLESISQKGFSRSGTANYFNDLQLILSDYKLGIMTFDAHMNIGWANNNMTKIFDFIPSQIIGKNWYRILPPMSERKSIYDKVLKGDALDFPEIEEKALDSIYYFDVHYRPLKDEKGKVKGILAIGNKVSHKIQPDHSESKSNDFILNTDIFHDPNLSLIVTNPEGFIERVNNTACKMYGKSEEELVNDHIVNLYSTHELKTLKKISNRLNYEGYVGFDTFHRKSDGTEFPVHVNVTAVKTIDGKPLYSIAGVFDRSERLAAS